MLPRSFDQEGRYVYLCKTANEAQRLPGMLDMLRVSGAQIVIKEIYNISANKQYTAMTNGIDATHRMVDKHTSRTARA